MAYRASARRCQLVQSRTFLAISPGQSQVKGPIEGTDAKKYQYNSVKYSIRHSWN